MTLAFPVLIHIHISSEVWLLRKLSYWSFSASTHACFTLKKCVLAKLPLNSMQQKQQCIQTPAEFGPIHDSWHFLSLKYILVAQKTGVSPQFDCLLHSDGTKRSGVLHTSDPHSRSGLGQHAQRAGPTAFSFHFHLLLRLCLHLLGFLFWKYNMFQALRSYFSTC